MFVGIGKRGSLLLALMLVHLSSCASGVPSPGTASISRPLPYPTRTPLPLITPLIAPPEITLPTATPIIYTIMPGDSFSTIAQKFGIPLKALQEANPGIDPKLLPIGATLVIPIGEAPPAEPTPTPVAMELRQSYCYPTAEGGVWCLALVTNPYAETVENLSVLFVLKSEDGEEIGRQEVFAPLDIVPPGQVMAITAFFPNVSQDNVELAARVLTASRLLPGDDRYLSVAMRNILVEVSWTGRSAQVSGKAMLETPDTIASRLWILAIAYDAHDHIVGVRRWEAQEKVQGETSFRLYVHSLSSAIERVELVAEAQK